jgi:hypothetical protein
MNKENELREPIPSFIDNIQLEEEEEGDEDFSTKESSDYESHVLLIPKENDVQDKGNMKEVDNLPRNVFLQSLIVYFMVACDSLCMCLCLCAKNNVSL